MSEPAVFVFVRGGQRTGFGDRWAGSLLKREVFWGPEELETWASQLEPLEEDELDDCESCVVVDYDAQTLTWPGDTSLEVPAIRDSFDQMLRSNWNGFTIHHADPIDNEFDDDEERDFELYRPKNIAAATRLSSDDDEEDFEDDEDEEAFGTFEDDETRCWLTLIDKPGKARHRHLEKLPSEIVKPDRSFAKQVIALDPAEIPAEKLVVEGMWIDVPNKSVGIWGDQELKEELDRIRSGWPGWNVVWADGGYQTHCQQTGVQGIPISKSEALSNILPGVISTQRLDLHSFLGAIGGGLKKKAVKATGCLLVLICLPILIFGIFSGQWKAVGITILIVCLLVAIAFKVIEFRLKKKFKKNVPITKPDEPTAPACAGPQDPEKREQLMDELLNRAGFPSLSQVKTEFPEPFNDEFGLLG